MSSPDNESSCLLQPSTSVPGIRTTTPQVFCVASLATLPSALFVSSTATMSAPSQPPHAPAAVNLQALLQPMIADAVQRAFRDLPSPSFAAANAPSSSAAAYIQPSSSSSQAPSSLGKSLRFSSFVSTVCLATGTPQSPILPTIASIASNSTLTSPAVANPVSSLSPASFAPGLPASTVPLPPCTSSSRAVRPGFDVGPGRPPIPPKLVDQIRNGEYVEFAELLPDSLRDNEVPQELLLESRQVVIPKRPPCREVKDIMSWLGCWIAYCQVVLAFIPSRAVELLKYLDLIVRTHSSFPAADVWLRYDRGFRRKAACSPVPLDWGATDLEVFHQSYASSNVLQPPPSSLSPFRRSADTLRPGEARGSPSGSEVCRTWNNGRCTSGFSQCK